MDGNSVMELDGCTRYMMYRYGFDDWRLGWRYGWAHARYTERGQAHHVGLDNVFYHGNVSASQLSISREQRRLCSGPA